MQISSLSILLQVWMTTLFALPAHLVELEDGKTFGVLSATTRDSSSYPLVLDPLRINMVTYGSLLTLLYYSSPALTVTVECRCLSYFVFACPKLWSSTNVTRSYRFTKWKRCIWSIWCLSSGLVDVGQGVFYKKVASLRIEFQRQPGIQTRI